jgi:hypothetical protein
MEEGRKERWGNSSSGESTSSIEGTKQPALLRETRRQEKS